MNQHDPMLFAMHASREFGEQIARQLTVPLAEHEERSFDDGEHKSRPSVNVRNRHVFVVQSLYSDPSLTVNDKLCRLLFFLAALRDASAATVTAVIPYLAYARKDQKSQARDPVTTRYVAQLFEAVGTSRLITLDVHNLAAYQNAFRIQTDHLVARPLFVEHFARVLADESKIVVLSPDAGGIKRAERFRERLERRLQRAIGSGFMEKERALGTMTPGRLIADVENGVVVILDDIISTGGTIGAAASACRTAGARHVFAAATHGLFVGRANEVLGSQAIDHIVTTDSVAPFRLDKDLQAQKLTLLPCAPLFAEAINRVETGGSIVDLLGP